LIAEMSTKYSTVQLFDMIETLDVYDAIAKENADEFAASQKNK
jgi:hypothetical protein